MSAQCIKCWKRTVGVRNINTGKYKDKNCQLGCTPIVELTCFSCGWCGHVQATHVSLSVNSFEFDEEAEIEPDHQWASITPFGIFPVGG